jgi:hypothetical protein
MIPNDAIIREDVVDHHPDTSIEHGSHQGADRSRDLIVRATSFYLQPRQKRDCGVFGEAPGKKAARQPRPQGRNV